MRVHHINCGTIRPFGGLLAEGHGRGAAETLVCHCLLIETEAGLVLVDTGLGRDELCVPRSRLSSLFSRMNRIQLREEDTAAGAVERLGFKRSDVRHIILTHLDFDHAGGIGDFPEATVHISDRELESATQPGPGPLSRQRYRKRQWDRTSRWKSYTSGGESWFGFDAVRQLQGLPEEILLVPLAGHTWGHCGVAVKGEDRWLLHAGDVYFHRGEMDRDRPRCPPGLRAYQALMEVDRPQRLANRERLRRLLHEHPGQVRIFSSHDPSELAAFS